jgi:hypothetical protein
MWKQITTLLALGTLAAACASADMTGTADAGHVCRVTGGCFDAGPVDAPPAPDSPPAPPDAADIDAPVDAPIVDAPVDAPIPDAPIPDARATDAPPATGTIAQMNMAPPAAGTALSFGPVVVVAARLTTVGGAARYAEVYVQDPGGGMYSGLHVFCDTMPRSSPACSTAMHDLIGGLQPGQVVSVSGVYATFNGEPELEQPMVTDSGTTMAPVAVSVTAAALADSQQTLSPSLASAYVHLAGPIHVSNVTASKFASTTGCSGGMTAYLGFDATAGSTTLAIGLGFPASVTYCLPGCTGATCAAPQLVTTGETFSSLAGIVSLSPASTSFVRVDPTSDADLPQ